MGLAQKPATSAANLRAGVMEVRWLSRHLDLRAFRYRRRVHELIRVLGVAEENAGLNHLFVIGLDLCEPFRVGNELKLGRAT